MMDSEDQVPWRLPPVELMLILVLPPTRKRSSDETES
jgi:hypothetical protein